MPEVFIQGGEGKLQAKYSPSEEEKPNIAIVLHPNPKHGGTMDSKVNYAAFKVMKDAGFSTLRINFRGVGKSEGAFTEGEGELNDASVSLDWLQKKNEDFRSCWIVGFSFGAWIGFQTLMRRPEVYGLILIAPPVNLYDFNFLSPCPIKTLILRAEQDEIVKKDKTVKGFNLGTNIGKVSGQSIMHCHFHLIPRRDGDVENPQGGVRSVIPNKQHYNRKI